MSWNFSEIQAQVKDAVAQVADAKGLEALRVKYLGRKGLVQEIFSGLGTVSPEDRPKIGKAANDLRQMIQALLEEKARTIGAGSGGNALQTKVDVTLPGSAVACGTRHLLTQTIDEICGLFEKIGFSVYEGPEIETEFHNFTALNIPVDHPSRDAFDTFYLEAKDPDNPSRNVLLRSHTSPGQIRMMKEHTPPLAVVIPGKVYRPDAVDASHSFMFHQIEGLLVDRDVKFSDLKGLLSVFCRKFFGEKIQMRFRPHFFPFTEPSAEVDISCYICGGSGCSTCGRKGWLEIMGCGLVHPKVFEAVGYPKGKYTGLAFGMGVERIAMLRHGIHDIRIFFENDIRFLKQF